jgi:putative N6-adenine-specific DNA methylase
LEALGYDIKREMASGVEVEGTFDDCIRLNHHLRTALRVLFRLDSFTADTADQMYRAVRNLPWEDWIPADGYLSVVSSVDTPVIDNTMYANMRCKDAIVDRIRMKKHQRPDSGPRTDRSVVFLYWHGEQCMVYLDTSGQPLSDRGYRLHPGKAPLKETLAAAILMATKWNGKGHVVNPMCGSGTLGIEAAMMLRGMLPAQGRKNFGYMHLLGNREWGIGNGEWGMGNGKDSPFPIPHSPFPRIICTDHDRRIIEQARENAKRAGVDDMIDFHVCDFRDTPMPPAEVREGGADIVILNPEYGLRLGDEEELKGTYAEIGDFFKQHCQGYTGYVFTGNLPLTKVIGLKASKRTVFWTADVECRLVEFELYGGSRRTD